MEAQSRSIQFRFRGGAAKARGESLTVCNAVFGITLSSAGFDIQYRSLIAYLYAV
jgi:hypothetical protein